MIDFKNGSVFKLKKVEDTKFGDELRPILIDGEKILGCYQDVRDHVVFTDKRIIAVNVQGLTGKKKDFTFLPYSKITVFSIETAGLLALILPKRTETVRVRTVMPITRTQTTKTIKTTRTIRTTRMKSHTYI